MTNTVEYRATLDSSGVIAGAEQAVQAINSINGGTASSAATATTNLDATGNAAKAVGAALQASGSQASEGLQRVVKSSKEAETSQRQAVSAGEQLLSQLRDQITTSGKTAEELLRLKAAHAGVAAEAAPLILQLQNQRAAQAAAAQEAQVAEQALREEAAAKQRAQSVAEAYIATLRDQAATHGKTATEVARYRAAQLGVKDAAEPYIASLEAANKANARGALSAAQHANAMRMLPMQVTDVVTSVASGMPIWMVAIQQGGQVRDSFNGVGNALKGVASLVTPTTAVLGVLGGTAAAVALAYKQGSGEADGFRQSLVMTGNTAGVTVSQMGDIAKAVGDVVGGQHAASQALTQLAGTGAIAGESLQEFTTVAMNLERYAGQSVKTTAEHLAKLGDEPVKASIKLNEQYHYLTDAVYQQIKALEDKGRKEEAAALAQKTYADAMAERAGTMKSNLGTLERAWESLGSMATKAWNAMLNVGRAATLGDIRAKVDETTRELNDLIATTGTTTEGGAYVDPGARARARKIAALQKQLGELNAQAAPLEAEELQAQVKAEEQAKNQARLTARQEIDEMRKNVRTRDDIRKDEIAKLNKNREILKLSEEEFSKLLAGINEKYKDPKRASAGGGIKVSDNEMATMRAQLAAAQQYHQQLVTMGPAASDLNAAEREALKISEELKLATDGKTIARLKEKQALADTLATQLRSNKGLEESYKAHQKLIDTTNSDADALEERALKQEAANKVHGKGQLAIEQMTLALLQHQMAEAQGSDRFDPKYINSLERKIAAQKHWTQALAETEQKRFDEHADKLLTNAREMAAVYADELQIAGATGIERERIVAARQVELKYAKERAAVDRQGLSDDERERRLARLAVAEQLESAAAVSKAQGDYNTKMADDTRKSLTDALLRGFENGKTAAQNLGDTVRNMFGTMVLRPTISAAMAPVSGAINSALEAVGIGEGSNSGLVNALTDWSGWGSKGSTWMMDKGMSLVTKGWDTAGSSLMSLGQTVQGVDTWLKSIPGMSGGIGSAAGYLGSIVSLTQGKYGSAAGSAIGTAILPGVGTMIGGFLGGLVDDIFGSDSIPRFGATAEYKGGQVARGWMPDGQWHDDAYNSVSAIAASIGGALDATAKAFGQAAGYSLYTSFSKDAENNGVFGALSITGPDGKNLIDWSQYNKDWGGRFFSDGDVGEKEFSAALAADLKSVFQKMDLPKWADQLLDAANDLNAVNSALQQIATTRVVIDSLAKSMDMFSGMTGDMETRLLAASGGIEALAANAGVFFESFLSEADRREAQRAQLLQSLGAVGVSIDPALGERAKEQFGAAVRAALSGGQAELAASLLAMGKDFAALADKAQQASDALRSSLTGLEGKFANGGFARQYQAEDAARAVAGLLSDVGIQKDVGALAQSLMSATSADVEGYFREIWSVLKTDDARQKLIGVTDTMLSLANAATSAASATDSATRRFAESASAALSARNSAGNVLDRIDQGMGGTGTAYALKREQQLWSAMATASYTQQIELASDLTDSVLSRMSMERESADKLADIHRSLRDSIEATRTGALSPLTLAQKVKEASDQFNAAVAKARSGDTEAAGQVAQLRQNYLQLAQRYYAASDDYTAIFNTTEGAISGLANQFQSDAQRQLAASNATIAQLQSLRDITQAAYNQADRDYVSSSAALEKQAALLSSVDGGIVKLGDIIKGLPVELAARLQPLMGGNTVIAGVGINGSHANGLARVPFDDYVARLHKDETVLTARQAEVFRTTDFSDFGRGMDAMAAELRFVRRELAQAQASYAQLLSALIQATDSASDKTAQQLRQAVREVAIAGVKPR